MSLSWSGRGRGRGVRLFRLLSLTLQRVPGADVSNETFVNSRIEKAGSGPDRLRRRAVGGKGGGGG